MLFRSCVRRPAGLSFDSVPYASHELPSGRMRCSLLPLAGLSAGLLLAAVHSVSGACSRAAPCRNSAADGSLWATAAQTPMTPEAYQAMRWEREIEERNRPLTDEDLDAMFPMARNPQPLLVLGACALLVVAARFARIESGPGLGGA